MKSIEKENDAEFEIWKALSLKDELLLKEYLSYYIGRNDKTVIAKNINHTAAKNTTIKSNANTSITANGVSTVSGGQKVNING